LGAQNIDHCRWDEVNVWGLLTGVSTKGILVLEAGLGAGRDTDVRELAFPVSNDLGDS
jgi:hypothetical protein